MLYLPDIICLLIRVFEVDFQDTCTRLEKYSNEFGFFCSFVRIFCGYREDTFSRYEKYPSKLDISRSFVRIFVEK